MQYSSYLISGATSGIGRATARQLAKSGASKIIITGRREDRLNELVKELNSPTCTVIPACFDIRNRKQVEDFVNNNASEISHLDVLINNAGLAAGRTEFASASIEDWEQMIDTNLKGLLYLTRSIVPYMIKRGGGHIVNLGSIAGHFTYPNGSVYAATKFAVRALNESLRMDLMGKSIRVTSIDPGMVETEFSIVRFKGDKAAADKVYEGMTPLKSEDIAEAILWSINRPLHVNVQEIILMPTDQASVRDIYRRNI